MPVIECREPVKYEGHIDIRFADLDFYGHVNSKHYVDLVSTVRLNFMINEMKTPVETVTARGIGFYLVKSSINYKRPIAGLQQVRSSSFVSEIRDNGVCIIPFELTTADGGKVFSDGVLEFALVDLKTNRKTQAPGWLIDILFHKSKSGHVELGYQGDNGSEVARSELDRGMG